MLILQLRLIMMSISRKFSKDYSKYIWHHELEKKKGKFFVDDVCVCMIKYIVLFRSSAYWEREKAKFRFAENIFERREHL